jgi:hypothetical protein
MRKMGADNKELSISINNRQKDSSFYFANASEVRGKSGFVKSINVKLGSNEFGFDQGVSNKSVSFNK